MDGFEKLQQLGLSLDHVFYLECMERGYTVKMEATHQTLGRRGYITVYNKLTEAGKSVLEAVRTGKAFQIVVKQGVRATEDAFNIWWDEYPKTDIFTWKNRRFDGARSLRAKKEDCRVKFYKIIGEGEYTGEDMIRALKYDVTAKKETSVREGNNKMTYMQNSYTYLNQRSFENFIEISKEKTTSINQSNSTDI